jgi:hypothetical protein
MSDIVDKTDFCRACRGRGSFPERTGFGTITDVECDECRGTGYRTVLVFPSKCPRAADTANATQAGGTNSAGGPVKAPLTEQAARHLSSENSVGFHQSLPVEASSPAESGAEGVSSKLSPSASPYPNPRNHYEEIENAKAEVQANG